jgi:hypothetical protein
MQIYNLAAMSNQKIVGKTSFNFTVKLDLVNSFFAQINATMYFVLSQAPTPLHSLKASETTKAELFGYLAYLEGCYGGLPTL